MSSPEKKRKTTVLVTTPESTSNPSLPDDLLLSCFARVSRLYYPTLSLVSKSFRCLLASPELDKTRTLLSLTESCLYVCLELSPDDSNPRWFTLCRKPQNNGYALATIPIPDSPPAHPSGLVALGSNIYNIFRSSVSILDCRTHTWHKGPNMRVEREHPTANVLNGKIYVTGGRRDCNSNFMEVLDPKTQTWEPVLSPLVECHTTNSVVIDGKIYMLDKNLTYKPEEDRWELVGVPYSFLVGSPLGSAYCVIDNLLYWYDDSLHKFGCYDYVTSFWMKVIGMPDFPSLGFRCFKMVNYGGKMVVFWNVDHNTMVWCAVIALERVNSEETIFGNVEWFDVLLTLPKEYRFVAALTAIV